MFRSGPCVLAKNASARVKSSKSLSQTLSVAALTSAGALLLLWQRAEVHADEPPFGRQLSEAPERQSVAALDVLKTKGIAAWGAYHFKYTKSALIYFVIPGDNSHRVVAPDSDVEKIKRPRAVNIFEGQALRDLALHRTHAAAVDARGDVWQWGTGFDSECRAPQKTLSNLDIVQIRATKYKLYALSSLGRLYVFSAQFEEQQARPPPRAPTSWWWPSFLPSLHTGIDVVELEVVNTALAKDERIEHFDAGEHHIVARTTSGRTLCSPVTLWANRWGQLGTRHVIAAGNRLELLPHGFGPGDPHPHAAQEYQGLSAAYNIPAWWLDTAFAGAGRPVLLLREPNTGTAPGESASERQPRFCTHLYEFKAMKDLGTVEVAAGARHNIARLADGRVVGWGANDHGQIGLGPMYNFPVLPVPAEIPLFRAYEIFGGRELPSVACTAVAAGIDTSYFIVNRSEVRWIGERDAAPLKRIEHYVDVLSCGQGRSGEIGDGQWLPRLYPTLLKNISSLREWSETRQAIVPIPVRSLSASHHAAAVLDNEVSTALAGHGRDVFLWGSNYDYQLGTGRRSNNCLPSRLRLNTKAGGMVSPGSAMPVNAAEPTLETMSLPYSRLQLAAPFIQDGRKVEETVVTGPGTCAIYRRIMTL